MGALSSIDPKYQTILDQLTPFILTFPPNLKHFDLNPFGVTISPENRYSCIDSKNARFFDLLYRLDGLSFGQVGMPMDKWVFFDCGEMPGAIYGFTMPAGQLSLDAKEEYEIFDDYDGPVPVSMYIAIPMASGSWFGHNLCTAQRVLKTKLPGLGLLTKALGLKAMNINTMFGATQWDSNSLNIHLQLADMKVHSSYTPAHSFVKTMTYESIYTDIGIISALNGIKRDSNNFDELIDGTNEELLKKMQDEIENGASFTLTGRPVQDTQDQKKYLLPIKRH